MHIGDYDLYHELLRRRCGLELSEDQSYLLDSHLTPVAKKWNFTTLEAMTMSLRGMPDPKLMQDVIEAMMVHDSRFVMDSRAFVFLEKTAMPHMLKSRRNKRLRFWSAACAGGYEAYSLAIALREMNPEMPGWHVDIQATDISRRILAQAEQGIFPQLDVQRGLPVRLLMKYFDQTRDGQWVVRNEIRKMVTFQPFNLLDPMQGLGQFDAIFCRNVLNTFDKDTTARVFAALAPQLAPDGFLLLGEDEAAPGPDSPLAPVNGVPGLFALKDNALRKAVG